MTFDYYIAIPSHRRADRLSETLTWIRAANQDLQRVIVFVSDEQDLVDYEVLKESYGVTIHATGSKNVVEKFNAIHNHFSPGTPVFVIEDDVTVVVADERDKPQTIQDLSRLILDGFAAAQKQKSKLWGIVPHSNPFYFGGRTTDTLKLVVAHASGSSQRATPRWK